MTATALVTYASVGLFRVYEVPAEYVSNRGARVPPPEHVRNLVRSSEARANAKRFLEISRRLIDQHRSPVGPTFCRLDRAPVGWDELDDQTRNWATTNTDAVEDILRLLELRHFYFADPNGGGRSTVQPGQLVGVPDEIAEVAPDWASMFDVYAPMLILELHGAKAEADGDPARAAMLYSAAVRGYWHTLSSERSDSDVLTVYAAAGHVFRRLGRLSASVVATHPSLAKRLRNDISRLAEERPSLHDINAWQRDVAMSHRLGTEITRRFEFALSGERASHSRRWLARPFGQTTRVNDSVPDVFTFGQRRKRLVQWRHSRQSSLLTEYDGMKGGEGLSEWLRYTASNWLTHNQWQHFLASTPSFYPLIAESPVDWIYADLDLRTDVEAAKCLAKFAADLHEGRSLTALLGSRIEQTAVWGLGRDPWTNMPFHFRPDGPAEPKLNSMNRPIPAGTPVLVSAGSPPQQAYKFKYDPNILAGGPRYYVLPKVVRDLIRQSTPTGRNGEKSD